jgi:hypothetical protein
LQETLALQGLQEQQQALLHPVVGPAAQVVLQEAAQQRLGMLMRRGRC